MVAAPTTTNPQCGSLRRGFHCAGLRLQDESKSDKPPSSTTTYHEHYQAHSAEQDTAASASDPAADQSTNPNTRSVIVTLQDAFWCRRATLGLTLPFVFVKLPGSERGARWGVRNRGAASGSNPDCCSGVCPSARLVDGSYRSWRWGERVVQRLYRIALCSYVSCTVNAVVVVSVPESGFVFCFHRYVRERIRRPGPTFHRSVQCAADGDPGWTTQSGPAGPGWVCIHSSSLCSSATLYCHKYLLSAFTNICTWSWHYLKHFGVLKH